MENQIFKVGDKVFDILFGWGNITCTNSYAPYQVLVLYGKGNEQSYTKDGKYHLGDLHPFLSFTEYTLNGFSQERTINYEDCIGCWGRFWDDDNRKVEGVLEKIDTGKYPYFREHGCEYKHFEPYPQEVLTALGLTNEKK